MYKWLILTKKHENNGIEVITDKFSKLWLNERHVQQQLGLKNVQYTILITGLIFIFINTNLQ